MPSPPDWLAGLANRVSVQMNPMDILAPVGCHFYYSARRDVWEITLFASSTEIVGGERDGINNASGFTLDVLAVSRLLDEVTAAHWQPLADGPDDELGPHICIEGRCEDHQVSLRILAHAPRRFEAGRRASVYEFRLEDIW